MTSQARTPSRADGTLSASTLLIGSLSSAASAVVVHEFWRAGAILAAAATPLLVAIFSELLRRPITRVQTRTVTLAGPRPVRIATSAGGVPVRVYRARLRWRPVLITALLAFAIGASALTVSELALNRSVADRRDDTTLFAGPTQADRRTTIAPPVSERQRMPSEPGDRRHLERAEGTGSRAQKADRTETQVDGKTAQPTATTAPQATEKSTDSPTSAPDQQAMTTPSPTPTLPPDGQSTTTTPSGADAGQRP